MRPRRWTTAAVASAGLLLILPAGLRSQQDSQQDPPPDAPVGLEAQADLDGVRLTWEEAEDGNGTEPWFFRIYRDGEVYDSFESDHDFFDGDVDVGAVYTYEVAGVDVLGREGDHSQPVTVSIDDESPPTRPDDLAATAASASRIDLEWKASEDDDTEVVGYYVYRNGGSSPHDSVGGTGYSDTGLSAFTTYTYRVSAINVSGFESEKSNEASARTLDGSPPSAPADLTAEPVSDTRIDLDWSAASDPESGVDHYNIYVDGGKLDSTTETNYSDTGLSGNAERTYHVAAVNGAGAEGPRSNFATARTLDGSPPSAPSSLTASPEGARLVELSWSAANDPESGVDGYLIYRDGSSSPIDSTTSTTYRDDGLDPATSYTYQVSARNGDGFEGAKSNTAQVTTPAAADATPPSLPGDFTAEATATRVELSWTAADDPETGVEFYRVYRDGNALGTSPGGGFTDHTVEPESSYEYAVAAVNGDGLEGPRTAPLVVTTPGSEDLVPPAPPTGLRVVTD